MNDRPQRHLVEAGASPDGATGRSSKTAGKVVLAKTEAAERLGRGFGNGARPALSSPFLLGFDQIERALDEASRSASDGYPRSDIDESPPRARAGALRITLAVAGFAHDQIEVTQEESQLLIRGRQQEDKARDYVYRGIAARQFQRSFLLAEGMHVVRANLLMDCCRSTLLAPSPNA